MPAPDLTLVRKFKQRAEAALQGCVVRVMLYGSRARGDARAASDWDVAVLLSGTPTSEDSDVLSDIGFDLMMEYGQHVQTVPIDASHSAKDSSFVANIEREGLAA
jgi:predicted nucleotidyltransferase